MEKKDVRKDAYEELTFTNNFMFCTILQNNHGICKHSGKARRCG